MRILVKNQVVFVSAEEFHEIGLKIKSATTIHRASLNK